MFSVESMKSQQEFLKKAGFFNGEVNGIWGPESRAAMAGFACVNAAGNTNGDPLDGSKPAPEGYEIYNGYIRPVGEAPKSADSGNGQVQEKTVGSSTNLNENENLSADGVTPAADAAPSKQDTKKFNVTK